MTKNRLRLGKSWVSMYNIQHENAPIDEIIDVYRVRETNVYDEGLKSIFHRRHYPRQNASINFLIQKESNGNLYLPHMDSWDISQFMSGKPYIYSFDEHCTHKKCSYYAVTNDVLAFHEEDFNNVTDDDLMGEQTVGDMINAYSKLVGE